MVVLCGPQIVLDSQQKMLSNIYIHGLVTRGSPIPTNRKPFQASGLVITEVAGYRPFLWWSPARVRSPERAFAFGRYTRQGASANRSAWTVPTKHRMPRKGEPERLGALQGACVGGRTAEFTNEPSKAEVGWQGRASGLSQPLSKSSGFDEVFQVLVLCSTVKPGRVQPTPALGDL